MLFGQVAPFVAIAICVAAAPVHDDHDRSGRPDILGRMGPDAQRRSPPVVEHEPTVTGGQTVRSHMCFTCLSLACLCCARGRHGHRRNPERRRRHPGRHPLKLHFRVPSK
ncbi:hypothetical protein D3C73_1066100 [compost metagenome]